MPKPAPLPLGAREAILDWYDRAARALPFRRTNDPYAVLVAEAMAQQTQAARAGEAWLRFMARFPTVRALAAASPAEVLREWQGLGYNRRALNLWRAAQRIADVHDGNVPADLSDLDALPGIGPYTARAVAAIAFGHAVGAVDTNVRRVLGRIVAGDPAALGPAAVQALADASVPPDRPADWTHALMDVGATLCHARNPDCAHCPAAPWCRYAAQVPAATTETAPVAVRAGKRAPSAPFESTSRWLRGRIVDRLRAAPEGEWVAFHGPIGEHDRTAVSAALTALAREGLIEVDQGSADGDDAGFQARLPTG